MKVTIVEVGPRDGLQNESSTVSTADKVAFVDRLSAAGLPVIEVSAFVSPKWVPQMADAADVCAGITRRPGVRYAALVPNLAGLDRAHAAGVGEDRDLRGGVRNLQPQEHQPVDRRVARHAIGPCATARRSSVCGCGPTSRPRSGVHSRVMSPPGSRGRGLSGAHRDGRIRGVGQRYHRHRASRAGANRRSARSPSACRSPTSRSTSTTRAGRLSPMS